MDFDYSLESTIFQLGLQGGKATLLYELAFGRVDQSCTLSKFV